MKDLLESLDNMNQLLLVPENVAQLTQPFYVGDESQKAQPKVGQIYAIWCYLCRNKYS
jgi:hypothetical protein